MASRQPSPGRMTKSETLRFLASKAPQGLSTLATLRAVFRSRGGLLYPTWNALLGTSYLTWRRGVDRDARNSGLDRRETRELRHDVMRAILRIRGGA